MDDIDVSQHPTEESRWEAFTSLFSNAFSDELLPQRREYDGDRVDEHVARRRKATYRYILLGLAVMLAPIDAHNFYSGNLIPAIAGFLLLLLFVANIYQLGRNRDAFLAPAVVLLLALVLVVLSVVYGQTYNLYWIYPLLVALPVMLKTRVAVWLGVVCGVLVTPFVFMRFDTSTAIIVCFSMAHTWLISAWLMYAVSEQSRRLSALAVTDPLTGAFNRRHLQAEARHAFRLFERYQRPAAVLLMDIDFFKQVNDELGHDAGDQALRLVVKLIEERLRNVDTVYRYGGEEFVALLQETDAKSAVLVAEQIRMNIEDTSIVPGRSLTISIGVCDCTQAPSVDSWLILSDRALYRAKQMGRNQVVLADSRDALSLTVPTTS